MQLTYSKFEQELNKFLKRYLKDDSYDHLTERLNSPDKEVDKISEKINTFYQSQLKIDLRQTKDRVRIDRIITFSEKALRAEKFCKFLIEIARICVAEGKLDIAIEIFRKANKLSTGELIKAESLLDLADVYSRKANWSRSLEMINKAKTLYQSANDFKGLAKCENLSGTIYGELGDILKAKKSLLSGLSLINTDDDLELSANLYTNLGIVYHIQEDINDAINYLNKAVKLYTILGKNKRIAEVNLNIGLVYFDTGNNDEAIKIFDKAIDMAKDGNYLQVLCLLYLAKAEALLKTNSFYYASEFADKALEISHTADDKLTVADIYKVKGIVSRELNDFEASENYLQNSLRINNSYNNELNAAEASFELGILYEKINDSQLKKSHLQKSKDYFRNIGATSKVEEIESKLALNSAS